MTNLPNVLNLKPNRLLAELNAIRAIVIKQWLHTVRYPTWVLQLLIWPLIFPAAYILTARAFAGPEQIALPVFNAATGTDNYIGYIVIGTLVWMWQNIVLWNVGLSLREEQLRGTLESNWLTPVWRFSLLIGSILVQTVTIFFFIAVTFFEVPFPVSDSFSGQHWPGNIGFCSSISFHLRDWNYFCQSGLTHQGSKFSGSLRSRFCDDFLWDHLSD